MPRWWGAVLLQSAEYHFVVLHYTSLQLFFTVLHCRYAPLHFAAIYAEWQPLVTNYSFDFMGYKVLASNNFVIGKFPTCKKTTRWEPARFATRWISIYYGNTWFPIEQYNACLEPLRGVQMIDSLFVLEKRCPCNGESSYRKTLNVMLLCATLHAERHYFVTIAGDRMSPTCRTDHTEHTILTASGNVEVPIRMNPPR